MSERLQKREIVNSASYYLIDSNQQFQFLTKREIVSLARNKDNPQTIWSARLSTGILGLPDCKVGNRGPKGKSEVLLALGDKGLNKLIDLGCIPCPVCKPEQADGFYEAARDTIRAKYNLSSPRDFADKSIVPYNSARVNWEELYAEIKGFPQRFYLPEELKSDEVQLGKLRERFAFLSQSIPALGYYDSNSTERFTEFPTK